jgi:ketosteroid isomerase-like protein
VGAPRPRGFVNLRTVPRSNTEITHANSAAFSNQDVEAMLELYSPEAVVIDRRQVGWGEFRGHDALRSYYQGLFDNAEEIRENLEIVSEQGDTVIAACSLTAQLAGQPLGSGEVHFEYALRIVIDDGLIQAMDIYADAEAATAAG